LKWSLVSTFYFLSVKTVKKYQTILLVFLVSAAFVS